MICILVKSVIKLINLIDPMLKTPHTHMYMSNQILITCKCDVKRLSYNFIIIKQFSDIFCWWCNQNTKMLSVNIYLVIRVGGGGTRYAINYRPAAKKKTHVYIDVHMHILKFLNNLKIEFYIYIYWQLGFF